MTGPRVHERPFLECHIEFEIGEIRGKTTQWCNCQINLLPAEGIEER